MPGRMDPAVEGLPGRAALLACVRELPAGQRAVLVLRYFDDLSYGEMAAAMNCSMGTVASRLNRGHKMLAEKLKELGGK